MTDTTETEAGFDFDLLDKNLADIEDLPSFEVWPKGSYIALISAVPKVLKKVPTIVFDLELLETVELVEKDATPFKEGSTTGTMFQVTEQGLQFLKRFIAPFAAQFSEDNLKKLVPQIQNIKIALTMDHRVNEGKTYAAPKNIVII